MITQESRLESWNYLLSKEIVSCWIEGSAELPSFNQFLGLINILNVEADDKLFEEVASTLREIQASNKTQLSLDKLIYIQEHLAEWYFEIYLKKLAFKFQSPRIEIRDKFKKFLNSFWLDASPKYALDFASKIESFLLSLDKKYKQEKQTLLNQENQGKKAYDSLIFKIIQGKYNIRDKYENTNRVLLHIYKCKIRAEICDLKIQIISAIIRDNQLIIQELIESNSFLSNLQEKFSIETQKNNLLLSILFEQMCLVKTPDNFKKELEEHLGTPLNRWGSCGYINIDEIKKILLKKLSAITQDIYDQLIQELKIEVEANRTGNPNPKTVFLNPDINQHLVAINRNLKKTMLMNE